MRQHGQLDPTIESDPRVTSYEKYNARELSRDVIPEGADIAVMDVSFISQTLLHPALASILKDGGWMVALIKPQFELTRSALNKQGIVKQERDRKAAVERVLQSAAACGFEAVSVIPSPIEGGDGNREFLGYFVKKT